MNADASTSPPHFLLALLLEWHSPRTPLSLERTCVVHSLPELLSLFRFMASVFSPIPSGCFRSADRLLYHARSALLRWMRCARRQTAWTKTPWWSSSAARRWSGKQMPVVRATAVSFETYVCLLGGRVAGTPPLPLLVPYVTAVPISRRRMHPKTQLPALGTILYPCCLNSQRRCFLFEVPDGPPLECMHGVPIHSPASACRHARG